MEETDLSAAPDLDTVIDNLLRPGFPAMTALSPAQASDRLRGYVDDVARTDIQRVANIRYEPEVVKQLISALARSVATDVTFKTLAAGVRAVGPTIDEETVSNHVGLLQRLFIVEAQRPWTPALRSRARVRTSRKLHLVDPALAAAALSAGPRQLKGDLATLATLFESAVVHDLSVLAPRIDGEVSHYRDSNGKEIDAVITLPHGRWGAVEVKLGGQQLTAGAASLRAAIEQVDTTAIGEPAFRLVVTGTGPTLLPDDETIAAPLTALAPWRSWSQSNPPVDGHRPVATDADSGSVVEPAPAATEIDRQSAQTPAAAHPTETGREAEAGLLPGLDEPGATYLQVSWRRIGDSNP